MSLVVEDGTGLETANTYATIAEADSYHSDRGNSAWTEATEPAKTEALILATEYLDARYYFRWKGFKKREKQALEWPRTWVYDRNGWLFASDKVPDRLKDAAAEAALKALTETLFPDITRDDMARRVTVGPITTEYKQSAPATKQYTKVDRLLRGLVQPAGGIKIGRS